MFKYNIGLLIFLLPFHSTNIAAELEATLTWSELQRYGFAVNGVIKNVNVSVGEKINKDDVLVSLLGQPFTYKINQCQAAVNKLTPDISDAKLELTQAAELFERSVLSEVELQKIRGKYKTLIEAQKEKLARCQIAKWNANLAVLKAKQQAYVLNSNFLPGMIISDDNKSDMYVDLVSAKQASAIAMISHKQKLHFKVGDELKVIIDQQQFPAKIYSVAMKTSDNNLYKMEVVFYYGQMIEPGKLVKLSY